MRCTKKGRRAVAVVGGAELAFVCHHGRTETNKCINDFEDQEGFTFVDVKGDGNCLFNTLALYYGFNHPNKATSPKDLRADVVNYMITHLEDYAQYGVSREEIEEMRMDGKWNTDAGDLMLPASAKALHLHIQLYDIVPGTRTPYTKKRILLHHYPEEGNIPKDTVHVLRINRGHFGLLLPRHEPNMDALAASLSSVSVSSPSKNKTANSVKTASVKKAKMSTKNHLAALNAKEKEYRALLTMDHSTMNSATRKKVNLIPERLKKIAEKREELQQRNAVEQETIKKRSKTSKN
jgi:hypothetical protein